MKTGWVLKLRWLIGLRPGNDEFEINEAWFARELEAQRAFVLEQTEKRLQEVLEFGRRQESKAFTLATLSLIATGSLGIFGDLHFGRDALGYASICAVVLSVFSAIVTARIIFPVAWNVGLDPRLSTGKEPVGVDALRFNAFYALVRQYHHNQSIVAARGGPLSVLMVVITLQMGSILSVGILASLGSPASEPCGANVETTLCIPRAETPGFAVR